MNQTAILLVCAVLAAASSLATCDDTFDFKYLDFSLLQKPGWDQNIEKTKQALQLIGTIEGKDEEEKVSRIEGRIQELSQDPQLSDYMFVYSGLKNMVDPNKELTEDLTNSLLEICYIFSDLEYTRLHWFAPFLRKCVRAKFSHDYILTSNRVLSQEESEENQKAFDTLNHLIVRSSDNTVVLEGLRRFDLMDFSVNRVPNMRPEYHSERKQYIEEYVEFISIQCKKLRKGREFHFNVLTLAETFGISSDDLSTEAKILKEFNRICSSALHKDTKTTLGERGKYYEFPILKKQRTEEGRSTAPRMNNNSRPRTGRVGSRRIQ